MENLCLRMACALCGVCVVRACVWCVRVCTSGGSEVIVLSLGLCYDSD